jgi:glycosyltransferase involved in cell wall biosynthesis
VTAHPNVAVAVPCFDEADRLDPAALVQLASKAEALVILVDDGSTDGTAGLLAAVARDHPDAVEVVSLPANRGKAEAVRAGMQAGLDRGASIVGYLDADLATPVEEMVRLLGILDDRPDLAVVLGARVGLLGHDIRRTAARHYLGRVFATASSAVLGIPVYDTQCGSKAFRAGPELRAALARPFRNRWSFDVELLVRLLAEGVEASAMLEVPLESWHDVGGSKVSVPAGMSALLELGRLGFDRRRSTRRRRSTGG